MGAEIKKIIQEKSYYGKLASENLNQCIDLFAKYNNQALKRIPIEDRNKIDMCLDAYENYSKKEQELIQKLRRESKE